MSYEFTCGVCEQPMPHAGGHAAGVFMCGPVWGPGPDCFHRAIHDGVPLADGRVWLRNRWQRPTLALVPTVT